MTFFSRLKSYFNAPQQTKVIYTPYPFASIPGMVDPQLIASVFTNWRILSETLSKLPIDIYKPDGSGGREVYTAHPLYDMLHYNPNNYQTQYQLFNGAELKRNQHGNSFVWIHRNPMTGRAETLEQLFNIDGYKIMNGNLYYSRVNISPGEPEIIPAEDILHFKYIANDGIWGMNPIESLRLQINPLGKSFKTLDKFYENSAMTGRALKSQVGTHNTQGMQEATDKFNEKYGGYIEAGKLVPLPPNTEIQELSLNIKDAEFITSNLFSEKQIYNLYGVPFIDENAKYSNIEQMLLHFKASTMGAIVRQYRQELEFKLLSLGERKQNITIEFNINAMLESDTKSRIEYLTNLWKISVLSGNQIADIENLPSFTGGDLRWVQSNNFKSLDQIQVEYNAIEETQRKK